MKPRYAVLGIIFLASFQKSLTMENSNKEQQSSGLEPEPILIMVGNNALDNPSNVKELAQDLLNRYPDIYHYADLISHFIGKNHENKLAIPPKLLRAVWTLMEPICSIRYYEKNCTCQCYYDSPCGNCGFELIENPNCKIHSKLVVQRPIHSNCTDCFVGHMPV